MPSSIVAAAALVLLAAAPLLAQSTPVPAPPPMSFSAYFQTQYERLDRGDAVQDRVFFRRMVLTAEAHPLPRWAAVLQADLAPVVSGDRLIVKDAYIRYTGFEHRGVTLALGNQKTPFSRSQLQSSARRGIVERPFTGDKALGAPGRAISARADVWGAGEHLYVAAAFASALHAPASDELRIDGLAEARDDWNEGVLASGRAEWHPLGRMPSEHGRWDQDPAVRVMLGAAAYAWRNDGDRNLQGADSRVTADADAVNGLEVGGGLRAGRLSLDAELQRFTSAATSAGVTTGLYVSGRAEVRKAAIEGGWMLTREGVELVASGDVADADAFEAPWTRGAVGMNWYVRGHDLKFQFMHRVSRNAEGARSARTHATHLQAQIAF